MGAALVDTEAAAARLGLRPKTLAMWRVERRGPRFYKLGTGRTAAVRYAPEDLDAWLTRQTQTSTSDPGPTQAEEANAAA